MAYSVHVGEKIAQYESARLDRRILTVAARRRVAQSKNLNLAGETPAVPGKLGVKTRWLENTRAHITRKIISGFEKFSLEETKFLPIIMTAARETRIDLWKTICPEVRKNFGSKIYPAYARVKKLCP